MLIACKCLNVTLTVAPLPMDNENHPKSVEINVNLVQQQSKIKGDHLQFFEKVCIYKYIYMHGYIYIKCNGSLFDIFIFTYKCGYFFIQYRREIN